MGTFLAIYFMLDQQVFQLEMILVVFITYCNGYLYTKFQRSRYFKKVLFINIILGGLGLLLVFQNPEIKLFKWLIIIALGLFYNSFFLASFIRKIPLLKVFYVGFTWALLNGWFILPEMNWAIFFSSWLYITALVLPFDIRDMKKDNIVTFPKIIGVRNTKLLAYIFLFLALGISYFYANSPFFIAFLMSSAVSFILIYFADNQKKDAYFSFGIELCVGLPFLFFILLKYF